MAWRNFASRPSDETEYLIIGSGMSGLVSGALLGKYGHKVMVVEGHPDGVPGGCLHTFAQGGEQFCAGLHYIGVPNPMMRGLWDFMTNDLPLKENREDVYDHYPGVGALSPKTCEKELGIPIKAFSRVTGHLQLLAFVKLLWYPIAALVWFYYVITGSRDEVVMNYEKWCMKESGESKPREIWWTGRGDHGQPRDRCAAILQCCIISHYSRGTVFPDGGMPELVRRVCAKIKEQHGCVLVKAPVSEILMEGGRAVGAVIDGVTIKASKGVIVGANVEAALKLVPKNSLPTWEYAAKTCGTSAGHGCIFLTYDGKNHEDLDLPSGNAWVNEQWFLSYKQGVKGCIVYVIYEMPYIQRGGDYEDSKEEYTQKYFKLACELYPKLKHFSSFDSSTPASTEKYILSKDGCSYGLGFEQERFGEWNCVRALRPETEVPGLYLCSTDSLLHGVSGAMMSGVVATQAVLGAGVFGLLTGSTPNVFGDLLKTYAKKKKERQAAAESPKTK